MLTGITVAYTYFPINSSVISKIPVAEISRTQAEENYNLAVGRYKVGVGNYIEVKDAETTLSDAKLSYINAVFDYILSIAALNKAMGIQ